MTTVRLELPLTSREIDRVFWDAAAPGVPTEGIEGFLAFLHEKGIRTGVISNICYDGELVRERITSVLPDHEFEFIIATSEYMFRKPNRRIFDLALEKADLRSEDVWYIGDNYACDVEGARGAGIFPVWYLGASELPAEGKKEVLTIESWKALQELMTEKKS